VVTQICALWFFCRYVLKRRDVRKDLPYPKERHRLPVVLSPDEVQRLIASAKNLYHRTLLLTLYGAGLRRSEACQLKVHETGSSATEGWWEDLLNQRPLPIPWYQGFIPSWILRRFLARSRKSR
jgi:integrase